MDRSLVALVVLVALANPLRAQRFVPLIPFAGPPDPAFLAAPAPGLGGRQDVGAKLFPRAADHR